MPALASSVSALLSWSRDEAGRTAILKRLDADDVWTEIARTEATEYEATGLQPGRTYILAAAPVDEYGTLAPESEWQTVRVAPLADAGTPPRPATPATFAVAQDAGQLTARWTAGDDLEVTYELREGASWESSTLVARGLAESPYSWAWASSGARTFHLKAVDGLGRASLVSATSVITVHVLDDHVTDTELDESSGGWTGTRERLELDGSGGLQLETLGLFGAETDPFGSYVGVPWAATSWHEGKYTTPTIDLGVVERHRIELDLSGATQPFDVNTPFGACHWPALGVRRVKRDEDLVPLGTIGASSRTSWRATPLDAIDLDAEIDTSQTAAGAWDGWRPYVPGVYTFRRVRIRVTARGDGLRIVRIPTIVWRTRIVNRKREGVVVLPGGAPVTVNFPDTFQRVPVIAHGLLAGSTAIRVEHSFITTATVDLEAFDAAGTSVAATVHWHALGP